MFRGHVRGLGPAGLDPRELEQRVDELLQAEGVRNAVPSSAGRDRAAGERVLERSEHERHGVRNSWLMFEKNAVFARSISASASARLRSSSNASALSIRRDHVIASQLEERAIAIVERAARAHAGDEEPVRLVMAGARHGQDQRGVRRLRVRTAGHRAEPGGQIVDDDHPVARQAWPSGQRASSSAISPGAAGAPFLTPVAAARRAQWRSGWSR